MVKLYLFCTLGRLISNEKEAVESINMLHKAGPSTVVMSSSSLRGNDTLLGYGSRVSGE